MMASTIIVLKQGDMIEGGERSYFVFCGQGRLQEEGTGKLRPN